MQLSEIKLFCNDIHGMTLNSHGMELNLGLWSRKWCHGIFSIAAKFSRKFSCNLPKKYAPEKNSLIFVYKKPWKAPKKCKNHWWDIDVDSWDICEQTFWFVELFLVFKSYILNVIMFWLHNSAVVNIHKILQQRSLPYHTFENQTNTAFAWCNTRDGNVLSKDSIQRLMFLVGVFLQKRARLLQSLAFFL